MGRSTLGMLAAAATAVLATEAAAEAPAIALPGLPSIGRSAADASGVVFFLKSELKPGVVAVGSGHTLKLDELARAGRVELVLPRSLVRVAHSERFAVPPGRPFSLPGATLRGDFIVFAFATAPQGVRALIPGAEAKLLPGVRVRVLGPATRGRRDEHDAYGTVVSANPERIELDLDLSQRLGGWGGAPVLLATSGRVIGLVQATVKEKNSTRVLAAPIDGVLEALAEPLEKGAGRAFAAFASSAGAPPAPQTHTASATDSDEPRPLLEPTAGRGTNLNLMIEYPADGAEVAATACGTFVAGRAIAMRGTLRRFDAMLVIDTSHSTIDPAGTDVNGNGRVGAPRLGRLGSIFGAGSTDEGDSILAAEVAAARKILSGLDPRSSRVGLVSFAGEPVGESDGYASRKPAYTIEALTSDYSRIERGLDELLATEPEGSTHMAAGLDQATIELKGLRGAYSKLDPNSEKVVFFLTDGQPTLPYGPDAEADNVRAVLRAANRARRGDIRIYSFAIGPEALEGPIATVEMAARTGGTFTPVRNPGDLVDVVAEISFANLEKVQVEQADTHAQADPFRLTADGSWAGFVQLEPGSNPIRAEAVAEGGAAAERRIRVVLVDEPSHEHEPPKNLIVQRNRLLEDCLALAKQRRIEHEEARNDALRRELQLEIERERRKARERADEQRKALDLEPEE